MRHFRFTVSLLISFLLFTFAAAGSVSAQATAAQSFRLQPYVTGLTSPLLATNAKDGTKRLFIVQQGGIIKVVQPGSNVATDFMNITSRILSGGERGLLGLAFHPQFATNGYFFVNYTRLGDGDTIIARFKTTDATNTVGDPNSEKILLTIDQPFSNHNGGMIEFRNDNGVNNLYIGMGDGGSGNDPGNRAQNINELLGKFLRITPSLDANPLPPGYTNPPDNPYVGTAGADEIYAIGLRNPFRWSFDRGGTRQLWAGDVGQGSIEEVDIITQGGNFGWRIMEGTICTPGVNPNCTPPPGHIPPVFEYASTGARCSVTGGYVYRGTRGTLPDGAYVYGDYCTGEILIWQNNQQVPLFDWTINFNLSSFGEDEDGELYVCGLSSGTVERIVRAGANADFDGDLRTDFSVFRPSNGFWYILNSGTSPVRSQAFGTNGDIPAPEDYDGDNITDIAVFRPSNGTWNFVRSSNSTFGGIRFGQSGDVPVAGDFNGDAKADFAVFRPDFSGPSYWYILTNGTGAFSATAFGANGDIPVQADYDGDDKDDIAVFRPANGVWYRLGSLNGSVAGVRFGQSGDVLAQGDYDGDGKTDQAVYRAGVWYILRSTNATVQTNQFGLASDIAATGDYDGDDREDIAVFRPSTGFWYALQSSNGAIKSAPFGTGGDLPAPAYDQP